MKLYFFDIQPWEQSYIEEHFKDLHHTMLHDSLTSKNAYLFSDAEIICIFVQSHIDSAVLHQLPNLKLIITRSVGYEHIDIEEAHKRNIPVVNIPSYGDYTVAEYTFGLLLALSRKIIQANNQTKNLNFSRDNLMGFDLRNKILGVIGTGRIGRAVIKRAKGFEMNVIAFDPIQNAESAQSLGFTYTNSLTELLSQADIITLHLPLNKNTHHIINKNTIKTAKPNMYLINTSRGGLIETEALIWAFKQGIIAGAALDVFEEERDLQQALSAKRNSAFNSETFGLNCLLIHQTNVITSPHNAFNTYEAVIRIVQATETIIRDFISDKPINSIT